MGEPHPSRRPFGRVLGLAASLSGSAKNRSNVRTRQHEAAARNSHQTAGTEDVMKAQYLGHVVFYVKDLNQSLAFYRDLVGFKEVGRIFNGGAAALTSGRTHHELLLIQVGDAPGPPAGRRRGLYHIGIKDGNNLDELRTAKQELEQAAVPIDGMSDHTVSQSLDLRDPDGN